MFPPFVDFRETWPETFVSRYSRKKKKTFLDYKHKKLKKSKNWEFSKGFSPWFCQKLLIFPFLYFKPNRSGKCVSRYSRKKKRVSRL